MKIKIGPLEIELDEKKPEPETFEERFDRRSREFHEDFERFRSRFDSE